MRFGVFSSIVTGLISLGHVYLYVRMFRDTGAPRWLRTLAIIALVLLGPGFIVVRQLFWPLPYPWGGLFSALQWTWIIGASYLLVLMVLGDVARRVTSRTSAGTPESPERRRVLAVATAGAATAVTASTIGYGAWRAYAAAPEVTEVPIHLPLLPATLSGFTIVQLSDLHVGSLIQRRFVQDVVERVNALKPDLVAITGDLVDGSPAQLGEAVAMLRGLRSREGTFFVTGNHEYHSDDQAWAAALEGMGITVLRNRAVQVGDGALDLLGVDDWGGGRRRGARGYDLQRAAAGLAPERPRILLAHQPANFVNAVEQGVGLQLSGHTHGGQVFPMTALIRLHWEHVSGLYANKDSRLFVSRGTGFWGPPLRIGSPPEIAKIVLTT